MLFGLTGAGKSFVGNVIANHLQYNFWDGDEALTEEMQKCIDIKQHFSQKMRNQLVEALIEYIVSLQSKKNNLIVAQGLYKEINRQNIKLHFPESHFIYVKANHKIREKRLIKRNSKVSTDYAKLIDSSFELPVLEHDIIINNTTGNDIVRQFDKLLIKKSKHNN